MTQAAVDRVLALAEAYAAGRELQWALYASARGLRCERAGEEIPRCFVDTPEGEWCPTCVKRDPLFKEYLKVKRANRVQLRKLVAASARLSIPDRVEPEEPRPLLDLLEPR
ncbi:MAG: hypothetical protein V4597_08465 [Pseudomonadota bacterium]